MTDDLLQMKTIFQKDLEDLRRLEIEEEMQRTKLSRYAEHFKQNWILYAMIAPALIWFFLRSYLPIYDVLNAFRKNETLPPTPMIQSPWYGLYPLRILMFGRFAGDFWNAFRNTFALSMLGLIFGFPIPIFLALMFSEMRSGYRAVTQVLTYLPRFISMVVITSLIALLFAQGDVNNPNVGAGILHQLLQLFGIGYAEPVLNNPDFFRPIFIISGIWEGAGFGSIVFFAAIMAISPTSYEAARIDGANKLAQIRHVTFPGMAPTLTIMLVLRIGGVLSVGFEQVLLMTEGQVGHVLQSAEVLSSLVVRISAEFTGIGGGGATMAPGLALAIPTAIDLFNSLIAMFLVIGANFISRRVSNTSLF